ncbi:PAAR domain-containing protein [Aquimarina longa]|uniref:PAAR domain-containing protein n=1 Tax=Aquimarina longa TaxID=1080221 RepID=UPI000784BAE6|nr:PAAR domain-containing protein [Aquimarina longa]
MPGPATTVGSMHLCPMCTGTVPHVGGPVIGPGVPTVLIGNKPAATIGDLCTCVGPPDTIATGVSSVLIGGKPASTLGDTTAHGGSITEGNPTVLIGTGCSQPRAVMPIAEIPFPTISIVNRILGNTREAQANQEELRQQSEEQHGYLSEFNVSF